MVGRIRCEGRGSKRYISSILRCLQIDAVMLMIETYNELPTLRYSGKYPTSIVSPPETGKTTPQHNGADRPAEQLDKKPVEEVNGTRLSSETLEVRSSPLKSTSPHASPPPRRRSTVSPVRGRSPPRRPVIDSYRPGSPRSRSRSRGNGRRPSIPVDRYPSPEVRYRDSGKVDTYIPAGRKRSIDDAESIQGREKRHKSEDAEMSEGEIR